MVGVGGGTAFSGVWAEQSHKMEEDTCADKEEMRNGEG